jgi:hypothetical protein
MKKIIRWMKDKDWLKSENKKIVNDIYNNYMSEDILRFMLLIIIILGIILIIMGKFDFILGSLIIITIITIIILFKPKSYNQII